MIYIQNQGMRNELNPEGKFEYSASFLQSGSRNGAPIEYEQKAQNTMKTTNWKSSGTL